MKTKKKSSRTRSLESKLRRNRLKQEALRVNVSVQNVKLQPLHQTKSPLKKKKVSDPVTPKCIPGSPQEEHMISSSPGLCARSPEQENIPSSSYPEHSPGSPDQENIPSSSSPNSCQSSPEQQPIQSGSFSPLTPEQKRKIEENKFAAKIKQTNGLVLNMGPTWFKALEPEFTKPYFIRLSKFVEEERKKHTVYPPVHQVWAWTRMGNIRDVKVVILGQDPYHGPGQAHGLCFSVQRGIPPPPSLVNMFKELENDIPGFERPGHGFLNDWAKQGVLLLNAVLTVRAANANSHKDQGWEKLTDAVISWLNKNLSGVVFILWGAYAQKKGAYIDRKKHHVLKGLHPSPLSAHRGFFGCKHFSKCNSFLEQEGKKPIDWTDLSSS